MVKPTPHKIVLTEDKLTGIVVPALLLMGVHSALREVLSWTPNERYQYAHASADIFAEKSDALMYGKPAEKKALFGRLCRTLAILSLSPGGVDFFGEHFENTPLRGAP